MTSRGQPNTACNLNGLRGILRCHFGGLSRSGHTPQTYIEHGLCTEKIAGLLAVVATPDLSSTDPSQGRPLRRSRGWACPRMRDGADTHHGASRCHGCVTVDLIIRRPRCADRCRDHRCRSGNRVSAHGWHTSKSEARPLATLTGEDHLTLKRSRARHAAAPSVAKSCWRSEPEKQL